MEKQWEEVTLAEAQARGVNPKDIIPPEYCTRCEQFSNDGCWHEWSPWWQPFREGPAPTVFVPVKENNEHDS